MSAVEVPGWSFGDRLRKARTYRRIEIREMAALLGVSRVAISQWETDTARPRDLVTVARRWAEITQVPVEWLLGLGDDNCRFGYLLPIRAGPDNRARQQSA